MTSTPAAGSSGPAPPASESDGYPLTYRGREYPVADRVKAPPPSDLAEQRRNAAIVEQLIRELPFTSLDPECTDRTQIVKVYVESIGRLHDRQHEVERLFLTMCRTNLELQVQGELHEEVRGETLRAKEQEMLERGRFFPILDDRTLTAELTVEPPELIRMRLEKSLRVITESFVREVFAALDRFVGGQTAGLIEWHGEGDAACKFHFFSERVVQAETLSGVRTTQIEVPPGMNMDKAVIEVYRNEKDEVEGMDQHFHARHEHHLMNTKAHTLGAQTLLIPEPAQRLIEVIPDWLKPLVRIIEGDRIREQIIEREMRTDKWKKIHFRTFRHKLRAHHYSDPTIQEGLYFHIDPAVTLDCYVLTGWGECAIREEEERQELLRQKQELAGRRSARSGAMQDAGRRFWFAAGGAACMQALSLALVILSLVAPPLIIVAVLVTLASLGPVRSALQLWAESRMRQADWKYLTTGAAAALAASVGIQVLVLGALLPWLPLVVLGAVLAVIGNAFGQQTADCFRLLPELPH